MRSGRIIIISAALAAVLTACGTKKNTSVSVQSVAMICGFTEIIQSQQFSGIVSTGKEQSVTKDADRKVSEVYVKVGDQVKEGDKLFTYDSEQTQNSLERARLELEEMKNAQESKKNEKAQLEAAQKKASQSAQIDYILKIQEVETDIRENDYNMALKEREIARLEDSMKNLDVKAPISGRIEKAGTADAVKGGGTAFGDNDDGNYGSDDSSGDSDSAFIKIVENDNFRIKGTINEQNIQDLSSGMDMIIYSRVDETQTWRGTVNDIDMKNPEKDNNEGYYYGGGNDEMTSTSKYPFYVTIDSLDGLMIGQHVYMRADTGEYDDESVIRLDASFINDADGDPWIWAEDSSGLLEKRSVTIESYDDFDNTWEVTGGIDSEDYIAPSSSSYEAGMPCIENNSKAFETQDNGNEAVDYEDDYGFEDEEYVYDGEGYYEDEDFAYEDGDFAYEDEDYGWEDGEEGDIGLMLEEDVEDGGMEVGGFTAGGFNGGFMGGAVG